MVDVLKLSQGAVLASMLCTGQVVIAKEAADFSVYSRVESITYSENLSIDAWLDDLQAPNPDKGEHAFTHNVAEVGVTGLGFSLAGFTRRDYFFDFSNDTFNLVYNDKNDIPYPDDAHYDVLLKVAHVYIAGAKFGYSFSPIPKVTTKFSWGMFKAEDLLFGKISGYLTNKNKKIGGDLLLDYNYTEDVVLDRELTPPAEGHGRSIDMEIHWQPYDALKVHLLAEDLYGVIKWRRAPYTRATVTTVRTYTDKQGNSHRMPTISGREDFRNIHQSLPKHTTVDVDYRVNDFISLGAEYDRYGEVGMGRLNSRFYWRDIASLGVGYDFKAKAPRLDLDSRYLTLGISADSTDSKEAKYLNFSLGLKADF